MIVHPTDSNHAKNPDIVCDRADLDSGMVVNRNDVRAALSMLLAPGQVTEVRILEAEREYSNHVITLSGFFNDLDCLIDAIDSVHAASGIYVVLNPVHTDLLDRCANRLEMAKRGRSTSDVDIVARRWLLVDLDPERPSGVSATKGEHESARARAVTIAKVLAEDIGWPQPIVADSGNGFHLLYRVDLPTNDFGLVRQVLGGLAWRFDDEAVRVDTSTANAAQLCKLYGTKACKGSDTAERPHRMAHMLQVPTSMEPVTSEQLQTVAAWVPEPPSHTNATDCATVQGRLDPDWLDEWIAAHNLDVEGPYEWNGGRKWIFRTCPWNAAHTNKSAVLIQFADGGVLAKCHHTSCRHHTWADLRDLVEPGWPKRKEAMSNEDRGDPNHDGMGERSWELPAEFNAFRLPRFPVDCLPPWLREFVVAEAESIQVPVDMPGILVLAACAAALAPSTKVFIRPDWTEPVNLYTLVIQPPATRKSKAFRDVFAVVEEVERERQREMRSVITAAETAHRLMEERVKRAERNAASAKPGEREAKEAEAQQLALAMAGMHVPAPPRIIVDDATPEKLQSLLSLHGGCIALLSAEGDVIDMMGGRYSSNGRANLNVYLKAHPGDTLVIDRINRPSERVDHPALTIAVTIQPEVLRTLMDETGFRGRGIHARFLYSMPDDLLGHRKTSPDPVPNHVRDNYKGMMRRLLSFEPNTTSWGARDPKIVRFSAEARERFEQFMDWIESMLDPTGVLRPMVDWAGKLLGAVARIAGLLHLAEYADRPDPFREQVSVDIVTRSIRIGGYLLAHARAAYDQAGVDPRVQSARYVLERIKPIEADVFSERDLFEKTKSRFKTMDELRPIIELLCQHGYLRKRPVSAQIGPGRKPSPVIEVNPLWRSQNPRNSQNSGLDDKPLAGLDLDWVEQGGRLPWDTLNLPDAREDWDDDLAAD